MQTDFYRSAFRPQPPPLWFVTNGEKTVGPVVTDLLVRGVRYGRVHPECSVRMARQEAWRQVTAVRELASPSSPKPHSDPLLRMGQLVDRIRDRDERLHYMTHMALLMTGADAAMLHIADRPGAVPITRCILGPVSNARLGRSLSLSDRLYFSARKGRPVHGSPVDGLSQHSLAARFVGDYAPQGVAMIPFTASGKLLAQLELGRTDRRIRRADLVRAEGLCRSALRRYQN